jgi:hypothetical protein
MAARAAARSEGHGTALCAVEHEMTGDVDPEPRWIDGRRRSGARACLGEGQPGRLEHRGRSQAGVPGRAGDPSPVGIASMGRPP